MMYPRLVLARNLLTQDGVIFVSIDDNEVANLRDAAWTRCSARELRRDRSSGRSATQPKNRRVTFGDDHDYVLVYARECRRRTFRISACRATAEQDVRRTRTPTTTRAAVDSPRISGSERAATTAKD